MRKNVVRRIVVAELSFVVTYVGGLVLAHVIRERQF